MQETDAPRTVVQVFGQWYSGTSLLNLLLDSQEHIRGLGEAHHVHGGLLDTFCSCSMLQDCGFYRDVDPNAFYADCFRLYDCRVLVDTSKLESLMRPVRRSHPRRLSIVLSKEPHAWAYSMRTHHPDAGRSIASYFQEYAAFYRHHLQILEPSDGLRLCLTYAALTADPEAFVRHICALCAVPFSAERFSTWWNTDTHIVCGNAAVFRQAQPKSIFFDADEKYSGRRHQIFFDEEWKKDAAFMRECIAAYEAEGRRLDPVLALLNHEPLASQIDDLLKGLEGGTLDKRKDRDYEYSA